MAGYEASVVECLAMELRQLETFRIVMATMSMTEAAKRVYLIRGWSRRHANRKNRGLRFAEDGELYGSLLHRGDGLPLSNAGNTYLESET